MTFRPTALPNPRTPDPFGAPVLRWAIMGTGWIAERFVRSVRRHTGQQIVAVGSRQLDSAREFATREQITKAYGSYLELVADPEIDVVYVATPHTAHRDGALLALQAGKSVVVEKPLGVNAGQALDIANTAAELGLFCMEALWTQFLPKFDVLRILLADGALGEVRTVLADHGEYFPPGHRILRADLAGGPLLDLGTYPIALATWVLGTPLSVQAAGQPHPAGVNGQVSAVLTDPHGNQAVVHTTIFSTTPTTATIAGEDAVLILPGPFYQPGAFRLVSHDQQTDLSYAEPTIGHQALYFEAAEAARCIGEGRLETPLRPLADSVATLRVVDDIRNRLGLGYPGDR